MVDPRPEVELKGPLGPPRIRLMVYDLLLVLGLVVALPWLLYRVLTRDRYRKRLRERLSIALPDHRGRRRRAWIHAGSAGEMVAAVALARSLEKRRPDLEIVLSSVTTTGVEMAGKLLPGRVAFVLPLDFGPIVRRVVYRVDPAVLVLVELELWPNLVDTAKALEVPIAVANGRISETSRKRYGWPGVGRFVGIDRIDLYAVQGEAYRDALCELGVSPERVVVTGNMKVDTPRGAPGRRSDLRRALGIEEADHVIVAGSTHPGEEALIGRAALCLAADAERAVWLIVAPRHAERLADAERDLENAGTIPVRLTRLREGGRPDRPGSGRLAVVVVDTMGELADLYAAADLAIVGGSLVPGIGGHNVFEPVLAGAPTLVGGHHRNVGSDVLFLEGAGAIKVLKDPEMLLSEMRSILTGSGPALAAAGRLALDQARGAADRTSRLIDERCLS